jgi:hypothetical protein
MIPVKRTIALSVTAIFCFASVYGMVMGNVQYNDVMPMVGLVIGYYFGKGHVDSEVR